MSSSECQQTSVSQSVVTLRNTQSNNCTVQRLGRHPIKTISSLHTSVRLNVSECELVALVHGAAHWLGTQAYVRDLGITRPLIIESDRCEFESFCESTRLGFFNAISKRATCASKNMVVANRFVIKKVPTADNISNILTEAIDRKTLEPHIKAMLSWKCHRASYTN